MSASAQTGHCHSSVQAGERVCCQQVRGQRCAGMCVRVPVFTGVECLWGRRPCMVVGMMCGIPGVLGCSLTGLTGLRRRVRVLVVASRFRVLVVACSN